MSEYTKERELPLDGDQGEPSAFRVWLKDRLGWKSGSQHTPSEFEQKTQALREISAEGMMKRSFFGDDEHNYVETGKIWQLGTILGGNSEELGLLDLCSLGIIRFLKNMLQAPDKDEKETWAHWFFRHLFSIPFYLQQALVTILTIGLTVTGILPFVHFVLYPQIKYDQYGNFEDQEYAEKARNARARREFFFNPGSAMLVFLILVGISLIIKAANPLVFGDAAAILAIMQTAFAGIAALMLVAAVVSLTIHAVSSLVEWAAAKKTALSKGNKLLDQDEDEAPVNSSRQNDITQKDYERSENGYVQYYDEKIKGWRNTNPKWGTLLYTVAALGVVAALTLTIGYCVDPVGVFSFMEPFFSFVGGMFTQGLQNAGALSGLDFLASLSEPALQLIGQIFAGVVLVSASIFIPNLLRQISPFDIKLGSRAAEYQQDEEHSNLGERQMFQQGQPVNVKFLEEQLGVEANTTLFGTYIREGAETITVKLFVNSRYETFTLAKNTVEVSAAEQQGDQFGAPYSGGRGHSERKEQEHLRRRGDQSTHGGYPTTPSQYG